MSEVIEEFIRAHPSASENEAFEGFAAQERIRSWLGSDATRRERLRREFARVWIQMESKANGASATLVPPRPVTRAPDAPAPASAPTLPAPGSEPVLVKAQPAGPARHLKVLCTACEAVDVWAEAGHVRCRRCGHEYRDMLELIPVKEVGVLQFVFGEGSFAWIAAGGILLLLAALYLAATRL